MSWCVWVDCDRANDQTAHRCFERLFSASFKAITFHRPKKTVFSLKNRLTHTMLLHTLRYAHCVISARHVHRASEWELHASMFRFRWVDGAQDGLLFVFGAVRRIHRCDSQQHARHRGRAQCLTRYTILGRIAWSLLHSTSNLHHFNLRTSSLSEAEERGCRTRRRTGSFARANILNTILNIRNILNIVRPRKHELFTFNYCFSRDVQL